MKSIPCKLIMNTKNGYILSPIDCKSINAALKIASENGLAYRIFVKSYYISIPENILIIYSKFSNTIYKTIKNKWR